MKIAIISDIHANAAALNAFPETYDELWVIGDLVNFGPHPAEVVDWVRKHAHCVIRGNHDHAVGYDADPRCIPPYQLMAAETGRYSASVLTEEQKGYLRLLPLTIDRTIAGTRFHLCHATPSDPLFGYLEESAWTTEVISTHAEVLVVGHTHEPVLRQLGHVRMVNPGSLAGLRVTSPQASYATWENGELRLKRYSYRFEETISAIEAMPISQAVQQQLSKLITTGDLTAAGAYVCGKLKVLKH
jgi:putative phosphoesterase